MTNLFKNPWTLCVAVAVFVVFLLFAPGMGAFMGGGAIVKAFTALVAGVVLMVLVRIAKGTRVLFNSDEDAEDIHDHEIARAIILASLYLSFAIVVGAVFG